MGGDKYGNGGLIDVNDDLASGIDLGAKGAGLYFGGPGGASLASMGSKALFGEDKDGSSTLGKVNKGADMGLGAYNMAQGFQNASQMAKDAKLNETVDASKGFSGVTSAGKGVDVGGTNAFGNALGEGNDINKAITGSGEMMNKLNKAIQAKDMIGSLIGNNERNPNPQALMTDNNITSPTPAGGTQMMNQVIAAQLMNPASQNRLAFKYAPGRFA